MRCVCSRCSGRSLQIRSRQIPEHLEYRGSSSKTHKRHLPRQQGNHDHLNNQRDRDGGQPPILVSHGRGGQRARNRDGGVKQKFSAAWDVYRHDREFRRAAHVAMLFISALLLFPHYQWLGREHLGTSNQDLITWVIAQNISVGVISPLLGTIADRHGNRLAVRLAVFVSSLAPVVAVFLASGYVADGGRWYWVTFVLVGLCPVTMRMIQNYTLELVDEEQHPRYLSTMTFCFAVPFILSPLFGWLIDVLPYQYPFLAVSLMIAIGGVMTFRMSEPRHRRKQPT